MERPVYVFRPLMRPTDYGWTTRSWGNELYRYNGGDWILDDGEMDVAFAAPSLSIALGIYLPYQRNIEWKWVSRHWRDTEVNHPNGNPWHYMLRDGETEWGGDWGRDKHANYVASRRAMNWVSGQSGCANGRGSEFDIKDPHILARLVRRADTLEIVIPPSTLVCMYCGPTPAKEGE